MARKPTKATQVDFPFFDVLCRFYQGNKGRIRQRYKQLTKVYLDFNDPSKGSGFLRTPQFEALEMYVFLKEFGNNASIHALFEDWYRKTGVFESDKTVTQSLADAGQIDFFREIDLTDPKAYKAVFNHLKNNSAHYPNYIFALTMGTGKTILMATCIFYEFLLANKFPKDERFCHNALVFAPDKTVLQALKEIETFDLAKVVPPEYVAFLTAHLRFHFLDDAGMGLGTQDGSRFNIVISNAQKIIVKQREKAKGTWNRLDELAAKATETTSVYDQIADLYGWQPEDDKELVINARFQRLGRLPQLGIYVDEAHHALGTDLAKDFDMAKPSRLRETINRLAAELKHVAGSRVVACYNYTGTPYVGEQIMPEVVYAYGLKEAIKNNFLKRPQISGYANTRTEDFLRDAVASFWRSEGEKRREGMLPKLAIFAGTIDEVRTEVRPALEAVLSDLDIPIDRILVNVGDDKLTTSEDIREFNRLDTPGSNKQFILLVNKGKEGWNCRSLFGVALHREPKSKIFVLQASMRCLRNIGDIQETGHIYLSNDNLAILDDELQKNFRVSRADLEDAGKSDKLPYVVRDVPPPRKVKIKRVRKLYKTTKKAPSDGLDFKLGEIDTMPYTAVKTVRDGLNQSAHTTTEDISTARKQRRYSTLTLVAEIGRYFNTEEISCLQIEDTLRSSADGLDAILAMVNRHNEVLYDHIIPSLFRHLYDISDYTHHEEIEVELVKSGGSGGGFEKTFLGDPQKVASVDDVAYAQFKDRSFHLNHYIFDSKPEKAFFDTVVATEDVEEIFFTGMLTHGQSEFYISYVDPETHTVRHYYPDFLVRRKDGGYVLVEVKGDNMIDDVIVQAKEKAAKEMAAASAFTYIMVPGSTAQFGLPA